MNANELFQLTDDISDSVIGVRIEVRAREIKRTRNRDSDLVWVAYIVTTGNCGGLRSMTALKDKRGKRVMSHHGKGDLIEKINALAAERRLAL